MLGRLCVVAAAILHGAFSYEFRNVTEQPKYIMKDFFQDTTFSYWFAQEYDECKSLKPQQGVCLDFQETCYGRTLFPIIDKTRDWTVALPGDLFMFNETAPQVVDPELCSNDTYCHSQPIYIYNNTFQPLPAYNYRDRSVPNYGSCVVQFLIGDYPYKVTGPTGSISGGMYTTGASNTENAPNCQQACIADANCAYWTYTGVTVDADGNNCYRQSQKGLDVLIQGTPTNELCGFVKVNDSQLTSTWDGIRFCSMPTAYALTGERVCVPENTPDLRWQKTHCSAAKIGWIFANYTGDFSVKSQPDIRCEDIRNSSVCWDTLAIGTTAFNDTIKPSRNWGAFGSEDYHYGVEYSGDDVPTDCKAPDCYIDPWFAQVAEPYHVQVLPAAADHLHDSQIQCLFQYFIGDFPYKTSASTGAKYTVAKYNVPKRLTCQQNCLKNSDCYFYTFMPKGVVDVDDGATYNCYLQKKEAFDTLNLDMHADGNCGFAYDPLGTVAECFPDHDTQLCALAIPNAVSGMRICQPDVTPNFAWLTVTSTPCNYTGSDTNSAATPVMAITAFVGAMLTTLAIVL